MKKQYNWDSLKKEYEVGNYASLKSFAIDKGLNYNTLRNKAKGWKQDKKAKELEISDKVAQQTVEARIDFEVDRNTTILELADKGLLKLNSVLNSANSIDEVKKGFSALKDYQSIHKLVMENHQDSQRPHPLQKVTDSLNDSISYYNAEFDTYLKYREEILGYLEEKGIELKSTSGIEYVDEDN